jgi:D-alanyl-D-alanine carboxypeptidase
VRNLTNALLIGSDNDAAMALGRYAAGGNLSQFVQLMNVRARQLGCVRTSFKNPNGLPASGQVTTAVDLLKIFQAAIAVPELRRICMTEKFNLATAAKHQILENHNKLLGRYDGMGPAKTGWTYSSRHTYAASCTRQGRELQLIILNSPDKWRDAQLLLNYAFSHLPGVPEPTTRSTATTPAQTTVKSG